MERPISTFIFRTNCYGVDGPAPLGRAHRSLQGFLPVSGWRDLLHHSLKGSSSEIHWRSSPRNSNTSDRR